MGEAVPPPLCGDVLDPSPVPQFPDDAERAGRVSRIVPAADLLDEAIAVATRIAEMSATAARRIKEAINRSFEVPLAEGLLYERRLFHATFATDDQPEGMAAFIAKRQPSFADR